MAYINGKKVLFAPTVTIEKKGLDTSGVTDLSSFAKENRFNEQLEYINTSSCNNFETILYGCDNLTKAPEWNTSNGKTFTRMFYQCKKMTVAPKYELAQGETFTSMFQYSGITEAPDYNFENGITFTSMFSYCRQLKTVGVLNASNGNVFNNMFSNCYVLETIAGLDISSAGSLTDMFTRCTNLKNMTINGQINIGGFDVSASPLLTVESLLSIFNALADKTSYTGGVPFTVYIGSTNKAKLTEEQLAIALNKGWVVS